MIRTANLTRDYSSFRAVNNISFSVEKDKFLGFFGPNDAGKSTIMKMLVSFLSPTSVSASIGNHDIQKEQIEAKKQIGYLPKKEPLYQEMAVVEFLKFAAEIDASKGNDVNKAGSINLLPVPALSLI